MITSRRGGGWGMGAVKESNQRFMSVHNKVILDKGITNTLVVMMVVMLLV